MADRELSSILTSGEISGINLGGTDSSNAVVTAADLVPSLIAVGASSSLVAQTIVANTDTKLFYFSAASIMSGTDFTFDIVNQEVNIVNAGAYKLSGTISVLNGNANEIHTIIAYINGVATPMKATRTGNGEMVFIGASMFNDNDTLELYINSTTTSITVEFSSLIIEKI